ncbi:MAG TPA: cysteine--tRNA ligase [Candidatus Paceibacterota bacterium]|nr:cysteine--tRNA ligase [Candidatus Paceibacterota bacterium]
MSFIQGIFVALRNAIHDLLNGGSPRPEELSAPIVFHNSLSGTREPFTPHSPERVTMYNCGPTAYDVAHIGNLRSYVFADTVRRTLLTAGYHVHQVINITDFGHLSSDGDYGDDKMTKALKREGKELTLKNMRLLAEKYTEIFISDLSRLNVDTAAIQFPRASDYIAAQISIIQMLEEKGFAYRGDDGMYFDTGRFPAYGKLGNINLEGLKEGARVAATSAKRNPTDFLLWKLDAKMGWDSPWGKGFPGWHIECSAMIRETLGWQIDIHTGGIDLMPTHHNNEIAQSESASGKKPFTRYWLHHEFLNIKDEKISKSVGNIINLSTVLERGYHPLSLRYLYLTAHYRSPMNFTWEALDAAQTAFLKLRKFVDEVAALGSLPSPYVQRFAAKISDDLDTPGALSVMWNMLGDKDVSRENARAGLIEFDKVLGLNLAQADEHAKDLYRKEFGVPVGIHDVPERIQDLLTQREAARMEKRWGDADDLRQKIESAGYAVEDTQDGPRLVAKY